jgi:hypothetical protein
LRLVPPQGREKRPQFFERDLNALERPLEAGKKGKRHQRFTKERTSENARLARARGRGADRKLIENALSGDVPCLRVCIERLYPPYKAAPLPVEANDEAKDIRI